MDIIINLQATDEMDFIPFCDMDFGTQRKSKCGICGKREKGDWVNGEMNGDIICSACDTVWVYDENRDGYIKRMEQGMMMPTIDAHPVP
jgi:hypothetical protein